MAKETSEERAKREVELELDRQLEDTFPASDPLKITRRPPKSRPSLDPPSDGTPEVIKQKS